MVTRRWIALACLAVSLAYPARAMAAPRPPTTRVTYDVPSGSCPDELAFLELLARSSDVVVASDADTEVIVAVRVEAGRFHGTVTVTGDTTGARDVTAVRCRDVVRGLAVFTAIALDAYFARVESAPASPPAVPIPAPSPPLVPKARASPRPRARPQASPPSPHAAWSIEASLGTMLGPGRSLSALGATLELLAVHSFASVFRVGVRGAVDAPRDYGAGSLSYQAFWLQTEGCPVGGHTGGIFVTACILGQFGGQRAALAGVERGKTQVEPWAALGVAAHLRAPLGNDGYLDLAAAATRPLIAVDFSTQRGRAFVTPAIAPAFELGVGYVFR